MLVRAAPAVFAVVIIRAGVTLAAQTRRLFTELGLIV